MTTGPPTLEAIAVGDDDALWRRMMRDGRAAYRVEARGAARRRARLQSAKIFDATGAFVCDTAILNVSASGFRLTLSRNCVLPPRFGVHVDLSGEVLTAATAWRRDRVVGLRVIARTPPAPLKSSDCSALRGRYYAVKG